MGIMFKFFVFFCCLFSIEYYVMFLVFMQLCEFQWYFFGDKGFWYFKVIKMFFQVYMYVF